MKSSKEIILLCSLLTTRLLAVEPWTFFEDFNNPGLYGSLHPNWDQSSDSTNLDIWPDGRVGNQTLFNNQLSFTANDEVEQNGLIYLNRANNVNQYWLIGSDPSGYGSWTAVFEVNLNSNFTPSTTAGFVEGGLLVRNLYSGQNSAGWSSDKQGYWTGFGIKENGQKYFATDMFGTGTASDSFSSVNIESNHVYLKVKFDSNLLTLSSFYTEDIQNSGYFWNNPFRTENLSNWVDVPWYTKETPQDYLKAFSFGIGGYSDGTTVPDGTVGIDDFSFAIVPEPSALSLLAVGLGGLAIMRRRRP